MPVKKNSETRHRILDKLLQDKYHHYTMRDLNEHCNEELLDAGQEQVSLRTTQLDIKFMMGPQFDAPIEYYDMPRLNPKTGKTETVNCLRYEKEDFSIYNESLSADDKKMFTEALTMFSQFSGLPNESALNFLRVGFRAQSKDPVVGFSKSPMSDSSIFGDLFKAITNRLVIRLHYHVFTHAGEQRNVILHPYYLREYNRRWYLLASPDDSDILLTFSLDRIDEVEPLSDHIYKRCRIDIEKHLRDVIGVTVYEDKPVQDIVFWVDDISKEYVKTKKLHSSQYVISSDEKLRNDYPALEGGEFFSMRCRENYELIRELCSFGSDLVVLSPSEIQDKIIARQEKILEKYQSLRK